MAISELSSTKTGYINTSSFLGFSGEMYIGESDTELSGFGDFGGIFQIPLGQIPKKKGIGKITGIGFEIKTTTTSSGYNGCTARIEYLGKNITSDKFVISQLPAWRVGSNSERIKLNEGVTNSFLTEDSETCKNFRELFLEATEEDNHYFRIVRDVKSQGVYSKGHNNVKLIVHYKESNLKYYTNGQWKQCIPYYYDGKEWKQCITHCYKDGKWNQS